MHVLLLNKSKTKQRLCANSCALLILPCRAQNLLATQQTPPANTPYITQLFICKPSGPIRSQSRSKNWLAKIRKGLQAPTTSKPLQAPKPPEIARSRAISDAIQTTHSWLISVDISHPKHSSIATHLSTLHLHASFLSRP